MKYKSLDKDNNNRMDWIRDLDLYNHVHFSFYTLYNARDMDLMDKLQRYHIIYEDYIYNHCVYY
jgi:hypothetical protein